MYVQQIYADYNKKKIIFDLNLLVPIYFLESIESVELSLSYNCF